jgi:predicted small metal-binding protein
MARKMIDCREFGGDCTVAISADTEDELLDVAIDHAMRRHQEQDTPEFREQVRASIQETISA